MIQFLSQFELRVKVLQAIDPLVADSARQDPIQGPAISTPTVGTAASPAAHAATSTPQSSISSTPLPLRPTLTEKTADLNPLHGT